MSTPKPHCRLTASKDTAELIGSFLKAPDLGQLSQTSKNTQIIFSKQLNEMALLKAVFDADPTRVKEILAKPRPPKSKRIVLVKTHCKETYLSKKVVGRKFFIKKKAWRSVCKREWKNISPLEAAAWCGDIFLVRELLTHVPVNQRPEAINQLRGILKRQDTETHGSYLAPYKDLINAYDKYLHESKWGDTEPDDSINVCEKLLDLANQIWQKQRLLPSYALQEYCSSNFYVPTPEFLRDPYRLKGKIKSFENRQSVYYFVSHGVLNI